MTEGRARPFPTWTRRLLWLVMGIGLLAVAGPTLLYPLTRDQGIASYAADTILRGGAVFRDSWAPKGPLLQLLYALAFTLFGHSEFAIRLFDALWALVSAAAVYALAREAFEDRTAGIVSGWLYAFCYYFLVSFHAMATAEALMMPFLIASAWAMVRAVRRRSNRAFVLAGMAGSAVIWFKPATAVVIAALALWAAWRIWREGRDLKSLLRALAAMALGAVLGIVPVVLYLYNNGLAELIDIWRTYVGEGYLEGGGLADTGPLAKLNVVLGYLKSWQLVAWLAVAGAVTALARRRRNHPGEAPVVFLLAAVAAALVQGKLFEYHWIPVIAPLAVLAAVTLVGLAREAWAEGANRLGSHRNAFALVVILGLALWLGVDHLASYRWTLAYLTGGVTAEQYYARFDMGTDFSPNGARQAAAYLKAHTSPDETAYIWGAEPLVNFLAERRLPTRYIAAYVMIGDDPGLKAWQQEFMADLRRAPPTYLVLVEGDNHPLTPQGSIAQLDELPEFKQMLETEYAFEAQVEDYRFYRRK